MENTGADKLPLCPSHSTICLKQLFTNLYDVSSISKPGTGKPTIPAHFAPKERLLVALKMSYLSTHLHFHVTPSVRDKVSIPNPNFGDTFPCLRSLMDRRCRVYHTQELNG